MVTTSGTEIAKKIGCDTAACRTVVLVRHPARCHWDVEAGVQYSTAGKSVVWDQGRRLLVSKDTEGKLMTTESQQAEVRRPLTAVKPMTQQRQSVCFGPDRAFAHKIEAGRVWMEPHNWTRSTK